MTMSAYAMTCAESLRQVVHTDREAARAKPVGVSRPDSLLLARLRKGDERAFNQLVEKHHGALIRMALRYVADRDVAEEVVQDTWIAVIDGIKHFEGRSSLSTWMFSILIHKAKDRGVRESKHINFSALESIDEHGGEEAVDPSRFHASSELAGHWALPPQPWDEHTPERLLASKQAFAALNQALDELPRGLREVLVLKDVEGLESDEICAQLKITETNLYVRLHRARERVRQAVESALAGKPRTVSNPRVTTLMTTANAIRRTPCPGNTMSTRTHAGT
jgi:RNA polymerase sigma-70 factor (ECF subfamily)